jgi:hypothetical protein
LVTGGYLVTITIIITLEIKMSVTKKQVANRFNVNVNDVVQKGSKQLFVVHNYRNAHTILVSYTTIIGLYKKSIWHITKEKFSRTTSKQATQFCNGYANIVRVDSLEGLL